METLIDMEAANKTLLKKLLSAIFFALSSLAITVVNKTILSVYSFPSYQVLGLGQMVATITVLWVGRRVRLVHFPLLDYTVARRIWPLPLIYFGNMATGLGSTKELNLPMLTVLRRLSIPMTMIFEKIVLSVEASCSVQSSVMAMVAGAVIAAADDITFSMLGYALVLLNNVFSAANGVYLKKILDSQELSVYGLLYYDSFFMITPALIIALLTGNFASLNTYEHWNEPFFITYFLISCVMGVVLSYSVMLCTEYNSALTTSVIGSFKNIIVTYLGMVILDDYVFSWLNFMGMNISVLASLFYTYITFKQKRAYAPLTSDQTDNV